MKINDNNEKEKWHVLKNRRVRRKIVTVRAGAEKWRKGAGGRRCAIHGAG